MAVDRNGDPIVWSNAGLRPTVFVFFHVSVIIPLLLLPFIPFGKIFLAIWMITDLLLQRYDLSLQAAIMRCRLWVRGGERKIMARRRYQKLKRSTNR